jgi:hypothetical protein
MRRDPLVLSRLIVEMGGAGWAPACYEGDKGLEGECIGRVFTCQGMYAVRQCVCLEAVFDVTFVSRAIAPLID